MPFLKRPLLFALLAPLLFLLPLSAWGQFGVYGTVNGERVSGFTCQAPSGTCASPGGTVRPFGGSFGAQYEFRNFGRFRIGGDLRGSILSYNKSATEYQGGAGVVKQYSALGGVRASTGTPFRIVRPYAEIAAGYAKTNAASTDPTLYSNYTQVEGLVGVDIAILPYLDFRAIEVGAGALFGSGTHGTESIGAGVVFHMPR